MTPEIALAERTPEPTHIDAASTADQWITVREASQLTGIGKDTLVHRMTKPKGPNRFFQPHEFRPNPDGRGMQVLKSAVLRQPPLSATRSKGQARPDITARNRLKAELGRMPTREEVAAAMGGDYILSPAAAKRAAAYNTSLMAQAAQPAPLTNHIAYAAGHCTAWIEVYAVSQDIPAKQLLAGVVGVLRGGGK